MSKADVKEIVLAYFSKKELISIANFAGINRTNVDKDSLIKKILLEREDIVESIVNSYEQLDGVSINHFISEIFSIDQDAGRSIENLVKKHEIISALLLTDKLHLIERVADYARFVKQKRVSPLHFSFEINDQLTTEIVENKMNELFTGMNGSRARKVKFENAILKTETGSIIVRFSREIGRRHIRVLDDRTTCSGWDDHDDYPLKSFIVEIDKKQKIVKSNLNEDEIDGKSIIEAIISCLATDNNDESELNLVSSSYKTAILSEQFNEKLVSTIEEVKNSYLNQPDTQQALEMLKLAKATRIVLRGLPINGDLQQMEIKAGDIHAVFSALGLDINLLKEAQVASYEYELGDERRIKISNNAVQFIGNFPQTQMDAIRSVFENGKDGSN